MAGLQDHICERVRSEWDVLYIEQSWDANFQRGEGQKMRIANFFSWQFCFCCCCFFCVTVVLFFCVIVVVVFVFVIMLILQEL